MAFRISQEQRKLILRLLCDGCTLRAVSRVTGCHTQTIGNAILQFGTGCQIFLDETLRGLTLNHLECDEIWSFVGKKQARLTVEEKAECHDKGDVYLWTAVDAETKLIPSFIVGKRSADNARRLMMDLRERLVIPKPHATDPHAYQDARPVTITQISTDGFAGYPEAVDLAFGPYAKFGTIIKQYRNATMAYTPGEMVGTDRRGIRGIGPADERTICTSHVERNNLTIRTFMRRFTRLSLGFSKKLANHAAACAMFVAYYDFVWRCRYPDNSGRPGKKRPTAAMMAKVTDHLWNFDEFYRTVCNYG